MNPKPQTIASNLQDRIRALFLAQAEFLSESSSQFVSLSDELDKLGKVEPQTRLLQLSRLYTLTGNRERAEYYIRNARLLNANDVSIGLAQLTLFVNLGYFSESIPVFEALITPTSNVLTELACTPPGNGAFHAIKRLFEQASTMHLANISSGELFSAACRVMDSWGDTDQDYALALDIAGSIMRERKLFDQEHKKVQVVECPADGGLGYVRVKFDVNVDLDTAIDMTCEYAERLSRAPIKIPPSMIFEFEGKE